MLKMISLVVLSYVKDVIPNHLVYIYRQILHALKLHSVSVHLGKSVSEWTKQNFSKAFFRKFYLVHS